MADVVKQLEKLARYKEGFESETDEVMKAKYKGMIEKIEKDIAEAEKQVVKEEEKVEKKEEKAVDEVSEKIKKYTAIMDDSDDPEVKSMYQKRIEKLKAQIGEVKEQIKEEKKELQEKKDELKEAVKEVKEAEKSVRTQAIKKAEKTQVDRKEIGKAKKQRRKRLRGILTDLNKLVSESDTLRPKYQGEGVDLKRDAGRGSKPFGWRFKGKNNYRKPRPDQHEQPNVYYEGRPNRADVKPKASVKLEDGGMMAKGGKINMDRHIWEGWTVGDFIRELEIQFRFHPKFESKEEVKKWAMDNQPYYKKYIPEVVTYYWEKNNEKYQDGGEMMAKGGTTTKFPKPATLVMKGKSTGKKGANFKIYELDGVEYALVTPMRGEQFVDHANATKWRKPVFAEGGEITNIKPKQIKNLKDYVYRWYGKDGVADDDEAEFTPPVSKDEVEIAVGQYVAYCKKNPDKWGESDSFDREVVADIMQFNRNPETDMFHYPDLVEELKMTTILKKGGKTQGYDDREDESLGMRRGKTKSKDLVGSHEKKEKSRRDDAGFEKRDTKGTWEWKPEAIEKKLIPKSAMNKKPSAYYRNKFPNLVMLVK